MNTTALAGVPVKEINQFIEHFKRAIEPLELSQPNWLFTLRRRALEQFIDSGFPSQDDEDWRFTNISPIEKLRCKFPSKPAIEEIPSDIKKFLPFSDIPSNRLLFINGFFISELSTINEELDGGYIGNIENFISQDSATLKKVFELPGVELNDAFSALNMALFTDGALIIIPPGKKLTRPIHIANISSGKEPGITTNAQHIICAGENSALTIYETYSSYYQHTTFTNVFTRIFIGDGANVEHIRCQTENPNSFNIGTTLSRVGRASNFLSHSISLGAKIARHTIKSKLIGEGVESVFSGVYMASDSQLNDHHLVVEHIKPYCASHEYFNGILSDRARGVFNGRIYVHPNAIKTDAKQTNKNLLLSEDAVVNSKPQLEIYADDVKCTHGATVGRLNQDAIFYLRSRGINSHKARQMLICAFASEILEHIKDEASRLELEKIVNNWLQNHFVSL